MKRGDRRALDHSASRLPITPGEKLLGFEIGNLGLNIPPSALPHPLSKDVKRIDLVAGDRALHIQAGEGAFRLGWDEILERRVVHHLAADGRGEGASEGSWPERTFSRRKWPTRTF